MGRSRGGYSTKVHLSCDALGNPRRLRLTAGQAHDLQAAPALIQGEAAGAVIADRAYDSDALVALIEQQG